MTQARRSTIFLPALILAGAFVLFVAVLAWSRWPGRKPTPAAAPAPIAAPADPIATLEARATADPADGAAHHALAAQYFDAGRYADAVASYERAVKLLPTRALLWSALGEARVMASPRDPMPAAALADFRQAIALDPRDPRARYFLAVARDLQGNHKGAIDDWLALLADTPAGAAWEADLKRTIEQVGRINGIDVTSRIAAVVPRQPKPAVDLAPAPSLPGPSAGDLQAAVGLPADQQQQMAEGMVARLEQRLARTPANPEGWLMLVRSRMTLGRPDLAADALRRGIAANPQDADALRRQAALLGVR